MSDVVTWKGGTPDAAPAGAKPKRPLIVVTGMHRSGLLLCSEVLAMLGVDMERTAAPGDDALALQDDVLALFDRGVGTPMHDYPMPPAWWADKRVRPLLARMAQALGSALDGAPLPGISDSRMAKLMPLWTRVFAELGIAPRFVICLRDPAQLAGSLSAREGIDPDATEHRALDYAVDILRYTAGHDRLFIRFSEWADPTAVVARLQAFLGDANLVQANDLDTALQWLIRPAMSQHAQASTVARQPLVRHFFDLLYRFADGDGSDAALGERIRTFIDNYIAFRQLLGPFEARHRAALAADSPRLPAQPGASLRSAPMPPDPRLGGIGAALQAAEAANAQLMLTRVALEEDLAVARHAASEAERRARALEDRLGTSGASDAGDLVGTPGQGTELSRLQQVVSEMQVAYGRLEQAAIQTEAERNALARELDAIKDQHARTEQRALQTDGARAGVIRDLDAARAARAEAEGRAERLELVLHDHSMALSDTLATLSAAETTARTAEQRQVAAEQAAELARAEADRLRRELEEARRPPARKRRW